MSPCLVRRHAAEKPHQGGNAQPSSLILKDTELSALSYHREAKLVTERCQDRDRLQREIHPPPLIQAADQHCAASAAGPGHPSALDRQRMDVLRSDEPAGQVLDRLADGTRNRGDERRTSKHWPRQGPAQARQPQKAGIGPLHREDYWYADGSGHAGWHPGVGVHQVGTQRNLPSGGNAQSAPEVKQQSPPTAAPEPGGKIVLVEHGG